MRITEETNKKMKQEEEEKLNLQNEVVESIFVGDIISFYCKIVLAS